MEIQTIRKSCSTGKVTENIEMFSFKDSFMFPLYHHITDKNSNNYDNKTNNDIKDNTINNSLAQLQNSNNNNNKVTINKSRLITFDSTDPEFDEDSDPDADLDL